MNTAVSLLAVMIEHHAEPCWVGRVGHEATVSVEVGRRALAPCASSWAVFLFVSVVVLQILVRFFLNGWETSQGASEVNDFVAEVGLSLLAPRLSLGVGTNISRPRLRVSARSLTA